MSDLLRATAGTAPSKTQVTKVCHPSPVCRENEDARRLRGSLVLGHLLNERLSDVAEAEVTEDVFKSLKAQTKSFLQHSDILYDDNKTPNNWLKSELQEL